jgi:hypothetical protein
MAERIDTNRGATDAPTGGEERDGQELVMFLERDQLVADTSVPLPRAHLGRRANLGLWTLRVFVIMLSGMVIYTFASQLK